VSSGYFNTTGASNTFIGLSSGLSNTTGNCNTFIGVCSGHSVTTGIRNTFIGQITGGVNVSCAIALGYDANPLVNGGFAIGSAAAPVNTTSSVTSISTYMCVVVNGTNYRIPLYT